MKTDFSQLQCYIDCPRRYYNRHILCLRKVKYDERELDKDFGHCVHAALERLYIGKPLEEAKQAFRQEYVGLETEKAKTPANGEQLIQNYWNYWQKPVNDLSDTNLTTVGVEVVDSYKIVDEIEWIVKIDRIAKNGAGYWVIDHKTTKSIAYNYFWQFDPNMQMSGYCEYVRQKYGQCSGAIIDAISLGFRERAYKGNPAGFYCEFVRDIINRNTQQLEDFKHNVVHWCARLQKSIDTGIFPKNESACHQYKGCSYRELCISCDDENIRDTLYEKHDPTSYLTGGGK